MISQNKHPVSDTVRYCGLYDLLSNNYLISVSSHRPQLLLLLLLFLLSLIVFFTETEQIN